VKYDTITPRDHWMKLWIS